MEGTSTIDTELLELMRKLVRECSFDFNRVATKVKLYYSKKDREMTIKDHERQYLNIEASACRASFAADYNEIGNHKEASPVLMEPQTFEDVVKLQRHIEEQSRLSHARVFERVSVSLGVSPGSGATLAPNDEVVMALQRRAEAKRLEEEVAQLKKKETDENNALKCQRERLRNRFEEDSLDSMGINPLDAAETNSVVETEGSLINEQGRY